MLHSGVSVAPKTGLPLGWEKGNADVKELTEWFKWQVKREYGGRTWLLAIHFSFSKGTIRFVQDKEGGTFAVRSHGGIYHNLSQLSRYCSKILAPAPDKNTSHLPTPGEKVKEKAGFLGWAIPIEAWVLKDYLLYTANFSQTDPFPVANIVFSW